jgi:hypothetical protein
VTFPSTGAAAFVGATAYSPEQLHAVRAAFAEHVAATEGPDGHYADLVEHAPRLAAGVADLVSEHRTVLRAFDRLLRRAPVMDEAELRVCAGDVLRDMSRHRQRGADLVYEAYAIDIGGET